LRSEPATVDVPVILCGDRDEPKNRFWSEHAGAAAYVIKGRTGELVRALAKAIEASAKGGDSFFVQLSGGSLDIRDRIAAHLDAALFESVISAELRALANAGSFDRLFDRLAQLMSQVTRYRWIALATEHPERVAIHHHPSTRGIAEREARAALGLAESVAFVSVEDEDAVAEDVGPAPIVASVPFADVPVARFVFGPSQEGERDAASLVPVVARELGGAVKMAALVEESQQLAATDSLTGLMNRRAFASLMRGEIARCDRHGYPLTFALLDIDHFKKVNDLRGHAGGDRVLTAVGALLQSLLRRSDYAGRWGGEEFVITYTSTDVAGALQAAERLRKAVEDLVVNDEVGERIPVTVSVGLATWHAGESIESLVDRADRAMYASKTAGRNRVSVCAREDASSRAQLKLTGQPSVPAS
jgi:diguanylate cyclase (GGDEF)-like protein